RMSFPERWIAAIEARRLLVHGKRIQTEAHQLVLALPHVHPDDHRNVVWIGVEVLVPRPFRYQGGIARGPLVALAVDDAVALAVDAKQHRLTPVAVLRLPATWRYLEHHHAQPGAMETLADVDEKRAPRPLLVEKQRLLLEVSHERPRSQTALVLGGGEDGGFVFPRFSLYGSRNPLQLGVREEGTAGLGLADVIHAVKVEQIEERGVADADEARRRVPSVDRVVPGVGWNVHRVPLTPRCAPIIHDRVPFAFETEQLGAVRVPMGARASARLDLDHSRIDH